MKKKTASKKKTVARKVAPKKKVSKSETKSTVGITPLGEKVLVRLFTEEEMGTKLPFGIIIPDTATKEKTDRGVVVATGPGRIGDDNERIPVGVSIGDKVLFQWGDKIEYAGTEYYLVSESNIMAIIK